MSDITKRLAQQYERTGLDYLREAKAEIERLRERVDQVEAQRDAVAETLSDDNEQLQKRIEELEANHIPLDAKLSVSCVLEAGQLPRDLLLAVNGEPTDQAIDCCWLLGPYEREIKRLRGELQAHQDSNAYVECELQARIEELEKAIRHNAFNDDGECLVCGSGGEDEDV